MGQRRRRPRFAAKPLALRLDRGVSDGEQRLERNGASEPRVGGEIHAAHPAAAQFRGRRVGAEHGTRLEARVFLKQIGDTLGNGVARNAPARE